MYIFKYKIHKHTILNWHLLPNKKLDKITNVVDMNRLFRSRHSISDFQSPFFKSNVSCFLVVVVLGRSRCTARAAAQPEPLLERWARRSRCCCDQPRTPSRSTRMHTMHKEIPPMGPHLMASAPDQQVSYYTVSSLLFNITSSLYVSLAFPVPIGSL